MNEPKYSVQVMVSVSLMKRIERVCSDAQLHGMSEFVKMSRAAKLLGLIEAGLQSAELRLQQLDVSKELAPKTPSRRY
jgi:hypothetical protein